MACTRSASSIADKKDPTFARSDLLKLSRKQLHAFGVACIIQTVLSGKSYIVKQFYDLF